MKRSPLHRSTPLHRSRGINRRNPKRLRRLRAKQFGPQAELCRSLPCSACDASPPSDPHHLKSRGAGGDDSWCIPLCRRCHDRLHAAGSRFWTILRVDPMIVLGVVRRLVAENNSDSPVSPLLGMVAFR